MPAPALLHSASTALDCMLQLSMQKYKRVFMWRRMGLYYAHEATVQEGHDAPILTCVPDLEPGVARELLQLGVEQDVVGRLVGVQQRHLCVVRLVLQDGLYDLHFKWYTPSVTPLCTTGSLLSLP